MNLLDAKEFSKAIPLGGIGGEIVAKFLMQVLRLNKVNKYYKNSIQYEGLEFISEIISALEITYEVSDDDLKRIPQEGSFISVSNHPYGGIDGLLLIKLISEYRENFKIFANFLLQRIAPLKSYIFAVNPFENHKNAASSFGGVKQAVSHIKNGNAMGFFPAGEVSSYQSDINRICDKQWEIPALKFIKHAQVPVVPVYFEGTNSRLFHILGRIHPILRTAKLPSELFNKKRKPIKIRIGNPISVKEQNHFKDIELYGKYLRAKTYALGTSHEVKHFFRQIKVQRIKKAEKIIPKVATNLLCAEIEKLKKAYMLFKSKNFVVICAPSDEMPELLSEIGRLREITFREIGEGTNRSCDLDEYDLYYEQLIIWDEEAQKIVGAYRVGKGADIIDQYGKNGFYLNSLFRISPKFEPVLQQSLELGRSFIIKEYQRKPLSLFLLWKGILYFLLKHTEYRYLIGPVSISNNFSKFSKSLLVEFCQRHLFNTEFAAYIKPRKKFKVKDFKKVDTDMMLNHAANLEKLDQYIKDVEPALRTPVLLKKYIKLNAKIIGFNIDPKFNNSLDGFIMLDIYEIPLKIVQSLSKELEDESILARFKFK